MCTHHVYLTFWEKWVHRCSIHPSLIVCVGSDLHRPWFTEGADALHMCYPSSPQPCPFFPLVRTSRGRFLCRLLSPCLLASRLLSHAHHTTHVHSLFQLALTPKSLSNYHFRPTFPVVADNKGKMQSESTGRTKKKNPPKKSLHVGPSPHLRSSL